MNRVTKAEREIALILKQLELDTGSIVQELKLYDLDVTTMDDLDRMWQRRVEIEMWRQPGTKWEFYERD